MIIACFCGIIWKDNLLKEGEKALERDDVEGQELFLDASTYEDAGRGYAWVMLNYNTLSDENKEILFSMEEEKDDKGINIGEKMIWFIHHDTFTISSKIKEENKKNELDEKLSIHLI